MTTYSQDLTVYTQANTVFEGFQFLPIFRYLVSQVPGSTLAYAGVVGNKTITISMTSPARIGGETGYSKFFTYMDRVGGNYWDAGAGTESARRQRSDANDLFKRGRIVTITSDDFKVYAHGSYLVERCKVRWPGNMWLITGESEYDAWVAGGGSDPTPP